MEIEDTEQEILLEPEAFADVGDGVLTIQKNGTDVGTFTANQKTDTTINITVPVATSELTNDANFQNANDVANAISTHNQSSSAHQDIRQAITDEATARGNADNALQGQIDAITSSSDVVDIVGTYAELQAYDTQHLQNNDVIKVLQDETHDDAMTYWRWNKTTSTWTYIGAEGPYYTKSEANTLLDGKLDKSTVPDGFFDGPATITPASGTSVELDGALKLKSVDLYGDTTQQTYSGKNILDNTNLTYTYATNTDRFTLSTIATGIEATATTGASIQPIVLFKSVDLSSFVGKTVRMKGTFSAGEIRIGRMDSSGGNRTNVVIGSTSDTEISLVVPSDLGSSPYLFYGIRLPDTDSQLVSAFTNLILTIDNEDMSYEPYVGGTASPNPSFPQTVNVVTGTQTITVTDGDVSQTYTVDLGTIELCKIGTYQDYIYKSGNDWYVHKENEKVVLDGSNDEGWVTTGTRVRTTGVFGLLNNSTSVFIYYSNQLKNANSETSDNAFNVGSSAIFVKATSKTTTLSNWKTWLSSNNLIIYGSLATTTDTKITDNTLIGQLNAVLNATMYSPTTTISSSGNLPAILKIVGFTEHLNSLLEIAAEPEQEPVTYDNFVGTDGVNAGTAGLVPAPATTDAGKFLKADGTWDTAGSSVNIVQTTGTSQTDVMSQNAVSSTLFNNPSDQFQIKLGANATSTGNRSTTVGAYAKNNKDFSVALGSYAEPTRVGEVNIGVGTATIGYSSSSYRVLGGVYDGQDAHDAVTVNQVNSVIDNINSALNTNIPHIGS